MTPRGTLNYQKILINETSAPTSTPAPSNITLNSSQNEFDGFSFNMDNSDGYF